MKHGNKIYVIINIKYSDGRCFSNVGIEVETYKREGTYGTGIYTYLTFKSKGGYQEPLIYDTRYEGTTDIRKLAEICINQHCGVGNWELVEIREL